MSPSILRTLRHDRCTVKTPKLYFAEPGLLAWLLQIETPEQVSRDPFLGGIFEDMVVIEAMKAACNRGTPPQLSFSRDKSGLQIGLIRIVPYTETARLLFDQP